MRFRAVLVFWFKCCTLLLLTELLSHSTFQQLSKRDHFCIHYIKVRDKQKWYQRQLLWESIFCDSTISVEIDISASSSEFCNIIAKSWVHREDHNTIYSWTNTKTWCSTLNTVAAWSFSCRLCLGQNGKVSFSFVSNNGNSQTWTWTFWGEVATFLKFKGYHHCIVPYSWWFPDSSNATICKMIEWMVILISFIINIYVFSSKVSHYDHHWWA